VKVEDAETFSIFAVEAKSWNTKEGIIKIYVSDTQPQYAITAKHL
jgi:hypothetical protein